jgi:hypothetical protein
VGSPHGEEDPQGLNASDGPGARERTFLDECEKLEGAAAAAAQEAEREVRTHRRAKYLLGYPAVVFSATASASVFLGLPALTGILALVATVFTTAQQFQKPTAKEADHLDRAARSRHLGRQLRYLRLLELETAPYEARVERLKELSRLLEDVRGAPPPT